MKSVNFQQKHFALNIHISQSNAGNQMYLFSSNSNASGVMCTANTKTNTKPGTLGVLINNVHGDAKFA
jgi:hypothetical protein